MSKNKSISIDEAERLLSLDPDIPIEILPNGKIRVTGNMAKVVPKPLTLRQPLGGEYA